MRKAQVSAEFLIFVGLGFILAIAIIAIAAKQSIDFRTQIERDTIRNIALKVQREVLIATYAEDGYVREFELPDQVESLSYNVSMNNYTFIVVSKKGTYFVELPEFSGDINMGFNTINKTGGVINIH